jgi:methionine synthase II (cobalamin-independent)
MKKNILILGSILTLGISILFFIHFSNDHEECETIIDTVVDSNGNSVKIEKHICKEKFNF